MTDLMHIPECRVGDVTVLALHGPLVLEDGDTPLQDCVDRLVAEGRVKIVLDMRYVTRLDSFGIGLLVSKYMSAHNRGGQLKLLHVTPRAAQLLRITKLSSVFEIFESEDEAIRSFEPGPADERSSRRLVS
jgi:anti-anti-sigma factor